MELLGFVRFGVLNMAKKDALLDLSGKVFNICEPFFQRYQLTSFAYSRVYPDGSRTELWSDALALDHTYFKTKYILGAYTPNYFLEERFAVLQLKVSGYPKILREKYTQQLADQRDYFNNDHSFIVVNREPSFCEYFIYYAPREAHSILNFYINNLNILDNFAAYFKSAAADLITIADNHRIPAPRCSLINQRSNSFAPNCSKDLFYHSTKLSQREQEIAALLIKGKVAREVGDLLHISKRTVESHIEHMKQKANCHNKSELIGYLCNRRTQIFSEND